MYYFFFLKLTNLAILAKMCWGYSQTKNLFFRRSLKLDIPKKKKHSYGKESEKEVILDFEKVSKLHLNL